MWGSSRRAGLVAAIFGITLALGSPMAAAPLEKDPIAGMGHGVLFDPDSRPINVTPSFIRETQEFYIRRLLAAANSKARSDFEAIRPLLILGVPEQAKLIGNAMLIEWLIDRVRPADAGALSARNNFLRELLRWRISPVNQPVSRDSPLFVLPKDLAARFNAVIGGKQGAPVAPGEPTYEQVCDMAGVPVPPDWGAKGWESEGILEGAFIEPGFQTEVFVYDSAIPAGLCIALPRSDATSIQLLGIICVGKASGKACFWDNQENKKAVAIPKGASKPLASFASGAELEGGSGGVCTSCHRGENPFIIHPQTALGLPNLGDGKLKIDRWYSPMVASTWPQNPGPVSYPAPKGSRSDCQECHTQARNGRFPDLDKPSEYCNILALATQKTMPPAKPGHPNYAKHAADLNARCVGP